MADTAGTASSDLMAGAVGRISGWIDAVFSRPLAAVFKPFNDVFTPIPEFMWRLCAVALFVAAMLWVFRLKKEYVNLDAPSQAWYCDLRLWTIVSMLPHVLVYLLVF